MRFVTTPRFLEERRRYRLRFTCEQCAHFDPEARRCVHRYPVDDHVDAHQPLGPGPLVFCKEFELR